MSAEGTPVAMLPPEQAEIARLRVGMARVERERGIAKNAALALFRMLRSSVTIRNSAFADSSTFIGVRTASATSGVRDAGDTWRPFKGNSGIDGQHFERWPSRTRSARPCVGMRRGPGIFGATDRPGCRETASCSSPGCGCAPVHRTKPAMPNCCWMRTLNGCDASTGRPSASGVAADCALCPHDRWLLPTSAALFGPQTLSRASGPGRARPRGSAQDRRQPQGHTDRKQRH